MIIKYFDFVLLFIIFLYFRFAPSFLMVLLLPSGEIYRNSKDNIFSLPFIQINFHFFLLNSLIFRINIKP